MPPATNAEGSTANALSLQRNIIAAQIPGECTMEEMNNKSTCTLDVHPSCHSCHTTSMDKQKNSINEVSNKARVSTEPYCCASFSEVTDAALLLCAEDLSMIDDNCRTIIPQHVTLNRQHLPLLSDLREVSPSYKESIRLHSSSNQSNQLPSEPTVYQTQAHLSSHARYTASMDKGKRKIFEVSNKDQPFPETYAFASFSESDGNVELLCSEDFSAIADNRQQIMPEHLTHSRHHLPLQSNSHATAPSSNESKHYYYRKVHPLSTRNRGRSRPRKRSITSIQESQNIGNLMHNSQYLCEPGPSSNESAQGQPIPATDDNVNPPMSGLRHRRQGTVRPSSTRNQRRGQPRNRDLPSRQESFQRSGHGLRADIVANLIDVLDEHNELVQLFRTTRNKMAEANIPQFKVRLFGVVGSRQHELPTGDSIGAIVFEGGPAVERNFDVIIEQHDRRLQRVNKLNASYMSLQFPLIFLFGEDGYHLGRVLLNTGSSDDPPKQMTMLKYYSQMEQSSSIVPSSNSTGKEIVTHSEEIGLADLKESDTEENRLLSTYG
ncbi:hypothetical protein CTI12_AA187550 [Artemisia annua]|uniref:Helitron helicase-like domain-containing protein n=1 Tax=Artemisia annua TaxID=35608 RepID=A0A2U1P6N8_ARTAN|nr:hypothetical protein CTI12_AA187550 [Artemisia annua]